MIYYYTIKISEHEINSQACISNKLHCFLANFICTKTYEHMPFEIF